MNESGKMTFQIWKKLAIKFPEIVLGEFMVMPNHFHGIICITNIVGAPLAAPAFDLRKHNNDAEIVENMGAGKKGAASSAPTLGEIMRAFKSISAIAVNRILDRQGQPSWQRNYYERIIRDEKEFASIAEYIALNLIRWADDKENPDSAGI